MFSFWSNDEENSEKSHESDGEVERTGKPERFRYVSKKDERTSDLSEDNVYQNNRCVKASKEQRKQMDDMLKGVWSVRKDVRVNNAVKATDVGKKPYYSRHGGVSGQHVETNHTKEIPGGRIMTKTWSVPRQGYSYSDNTALGQIDVLGGNNTPDIPGDNIENPGVTSDKHDPDVHQQNIVNSLKYGATGPTVTKRELSARTKRAQKFNNAYLRSTGMGMYAPHMTKHSNQHGNHNKQWNS